MDPFNTVFHLRQQRNHMVQTEAQYVFLHDAILEEASSGITEVTVNKLGQRMGELEKVDEEEESGFKKEFRVSMLVWIDQGGHRTHPLVRPSVCMQALPSGPTWGSQPLPPPPSPV